MDEDAGLSALKDKLSREINFHAQHYSESHLKRRLKVRMHSTGVKTFGEYSKYLDTHPDEYSVLKNVLTVNVTEFFRNPEAFEAIKNEVLPVLYDSKVRSRKKTLRIWSAGSSDGKEAYSIAILLYETFGEKMKNLSVTIYATDIDEVMIKKGKEGFYNFNEVSGLSDTLLNKYFTKEENGYRASNNIKRLIRFEKKDLITGRKFQFIDFICCRNVVIYFSQPLKEKLYLEFYDSLANGGFFMMGKTETLFGEAKNKFIPFNNKERIYQKE